MNSTPAGNKRDKPSSTPSPDPNICKHMNLSTSPSQPPPPQPTPVDINSEGPRHTPGRALTFINMDNSTITSDNINNVNFRTDNTMSKPNSVRKSLDKDLCCPDMETVPEDCPPWAKHLLFRFSTLERAFDDVKQLNIETASTLNALSTDVADLRGAVDSITNRVSRIETETHRLSTLPQTVDELKRATQYVSDQYDNTRATSNDNATEILQTQKCLSSLESQCDTLQDRVIVQEERSMRDNLLFFGIPESDREESETVIQGFIQQMLPSIADKLPLRFERVHRIGKRSRQNGKHRPIVAKFSFHKDRELVRRNAASLKNTQYSIREQFPMEILQRRRVLEPKLKDARERNLRASLHRDTLRVEEKEYRVNRQGQIYQTDRVFQPRPMDKTRHDPPNGYQSREHNRGPGNQQSSSSASAQRPGDGN